MAADDFLRHWEGETVEKMPFAFICFQPYDAFGNFQWLVVGADGFHQIRFPLFGEFFHRVQSDFRAAAEFLCFGVGNRLFCKLWQMLDGLCNIFI